MLGGVDALVQGFRRVVVQDRHGLLADEPTLVYQPNGTIAAVGLSAARAQHNHPPHVSRPLLRGGHVTDTHAAGVLIRTLLHEHAKGIWSLGSR